MFPENLTKGDWNKILNIFRDKSVDSTSNKTSTKTEPLTPKEENIEGELILFWENGLIPFKDQTFYSFTVLPGNTDGVVSIYNEELNLTLPVPISKGKGKNNKFSDIEIFNVAFPKYVKEILIFLKLAL